MIGQKYLILFFLPFFLTTCIKTKITIFEDRRLGQEGLVKICLLGDLGLRSSYQKSIIEALRQEACHRIFFLGDLVYPDGINSKDDPNLKNAFLDFYLPLLKQDQSPVIGLLLGNHDYQGSPSSWIDVAQEHPGLFFPNNYYLIDYGGLCIVALDSNLYYYKEHIIKAVEQTTWMTQINSHLNSCNIKIALTHHPFKGSGYKGSQGWNGSKGLLKEFFDVYIIGKFDLLISGHLHILSDDGEHRGTRLLISGTGGENLGAGPGGYVVLTWKPKYPTRLQYYLKTVPL